MSRSVTNNRQQSRFELQLGDGVAFIAYREAGKDLTLVHTEVPEQWQGQGVASQLARAALDYARSNQLQVHPHCSFIAGFIKRNREYAELVAPQHRNEVGG